MNKKYFPCCRSKSVSQENLYEDGSGSQLRHAARRHNPIIIGLANHLREHHSSTRNSAVAGCLGIPDSPPKYDEVYAIACSHEGNRRKREGACEEDTTKKAVMAAERIDSSLEDDDELPPPSYKESLDMDMNLFTIDPVDQKNLTERIVIGYKD